MSWWQSLLLGVLQGLTEFLPVSSSGHLALGQMIFNRLGASFDQPGVVFDAMLHVGTAAAVVWAERREIVRWLTTPAGWRLIALCALGTVATALVAFPVRGAAKAGFESATVVGVCLLITGCVVLATRALPGGKRGETDMQWWQAAVIGLVQGLAVFPGISRSGSTIAASLGVGIDRAWAARFSFLLSVPAIAGATLVELVSERHALVEGGWAFWGNAAIGGLAAAFTGFFALKLVIRTVSSEVFHRFAWYCLPLGAFVLLVGRGWLE